MSLGDRLARAVGRGLGRVGGRLARSWAQRGGVTDRLPGWVVPRGRRMLDAVALAAVASAAASLAGLLPAAVVRALAAAARPTLGVVGVATVAVVLLTWRAGESDDAGWSERLRAAPPERVPAGDAVPPGAWVTLAAGESDRIARATTVGRYGSGVAREQLIDAVAETLTTVRDVDETTARTMVADGTWSDDPRAAAYLADGETPTVPPATRLRDWLSGERRQRRVRATVRELRRLDPGTDTPAAAEFETADAESTRPPAATATPDPTLAAETDREPAVAAATDGGAAGPRPAAERRDTDDGGDGGTPLGRPTETAGVWPPGDGETEVRREVEE